MQNDIKYVEEVDKIGARGVVLVCATEGRSGGSFLYVAFRNLQSNSSTGNRLGAGNSMCIEKRFAKPEMLTAMALLITKFDILLADYVNKDGSDSERGSKAIRGSVELPPCHQTDGALKIK